MDAFIELLAQGRSQKLMALEVEKVCESSGGREHVRDRPLGWNDTKVLGRY